MHWEPKYTIYLNILGTSNIFINMQVTGKGKKMLEGAVIKGNKQEREILVSLQNMKRFGIVHPTFGFETIDQFIYNQNKNNYSEK